MTLSLKDELDGWLRKAAQDLRARQPAPRLEQIGVTERVGDGVATLTGLPEARLDGLLVFEGGVPGLVVALEPESIGCILLGPDQDVTAGSRVADTGDVIRVPVGEALLGRVVNALGIPLDGGPVIVAERYDVVEKSGPSVVERALVTEPLHTGLTVIDALLPLGRGQRELVIGDRSTGKTAITVDAIIHQRSSDVVCIYVAVGQRGSSVNHVIESVRRRGAFERCIFVVGEADDPPGLQWLAPYAACSMAEYFMDRGRHALIVIDDLTKHAAIYRQLSLLLRHPPGREAYPGDIFYIHSRLLERSAKLNDERGGGSLTALPIAETQAGNLSAYIPTNLVSITDGQIYLEPKLFHEGQRPAVNVGKSVSRVGGKTQSPALRNLAQDLRLKYAQFLELEVFTRFGGVVDERSRKTIDHGRRIRAVLCQPQLDPIPLGEQTVLLIALNEGILDGIALEQVEDFRRKLRAWLDRNGRDVRARLETGQQLAEVDRMALLADLRALAGLRSDILPPAEDGMSSGEA